LKQLAVERNTGTPPLRIFEGRRTGSDVHAVRKSVDDDLRIALIIFKLNTPIWKQ